MILLVVLVQGYFLEQAKTYQSCVYSTKLLTAKNIKSFAIAWAARNQSVHESDNVLLSHDDKVAYGTDC